MGGGGGLQTPPIFWITFAGAWGTSLGYPYERAKELWKAFKNPDATFDSDPKAVAPDRVQNRRCRPGGVIRRTVSTCPKVTLRRIGTRGARSLSVQNELGLST